MKIKLLAILSLVLLTSCVTNGSYRLIFKSDISEIEIRRSSVVAAELGQGITGNTRVVITVNPGGLSAINKFLAENLNRNMDIIFGDEIVSSSMPIRTDHFMKDIVITFKDKNLAQIFYEKFSPKL